MCSLENPKWKDVSSQSCKAGSGFGGGRSRRQLYAAKEKKTNTAEIYRLISRFVALFDGIQACKSDFSCSHAGKMIVKLKDTLSLKCINTMKQTNMSYSMKSFVGLSKSCFLIQRLLKVCSHFYTSISRQEMVYGFTSYKWTWPTPLVFFLYSLLFGLGFIWFGGMKTLFSRGSAAQFVFQFWSIFF